MPQRCVIHIPQISVLPLVYSNTIGNYWYEGLLYISAWGLYVVRFDKQGNSYEPQIVKRATVQGFTLFYAI